MKGSRDGPGPNTIWIDIAGSERIIASSWVPPHVLRILVAGGVAVNFMAGIAISNLPSF